MNIAIVVGLAALALKFASDTLSEIGTIKKEGRGEETFKWRNLWHIIPLLKVLATGAAFAAGVVALLNL